MAQSFYYMGLILYIISFFLTATRLYGTPVIGYKCAATLLMAIVESGSGSMFLFVIFLNCSNILTLLSIALHLKFGITKIIIPQTIALLSALYWIPNAAAFSNGDFDELYSGYWIWVAGILMMTIGSFLSSRGGGP